MAATSARTWVTINDAAEHYAVTENTIRRWIDAGYLYAERFGPRMIRVDLDSLLRQPLSPERS